jgi:hypothetical protein
MDNFDRHLKESLKVRAINIVNETAMTNPKYKELSKKVSCLEQELIDLIPDKFELFDDYRDAVLQRESFLMELVFLQGFADGVGMKELLKE